MGSIIAVIPARFNSSRFPGKPLAQIAGKSLIVRTLENAARCPLLDKVIVATDSDQIFTHVQQHGGEAVMTDEACPTGTDRIANALLRHPELAQGGIVVNVQGDWPCINPDVIGRVAEALLADPEAAVATAAVPIESMSHSPSVVKCVFDQRGRALYFSRAPIPYGSDGGYAHLGLYAYRPSFLRRYAGLKPTPLESAENLEQLRVLEHGFPIAVAVVDCDVISVDVPEDIAKVEEHLCSLSTYS